MFKFPKDSHAVVISPSIVIFTIGLILGLYFLFVIKSIITLLFLAFIIMTALRPTVNLFQNKLRLPRIISVVIVYLIALLSLSVLLALLLPPLGNELYQLVRTINLPFLEQEVTELRFTITELTDLVQRVGSSAGIVFSIISMTFSSLFAFFTLIVVSFYLMMDRPYLHRKIAWFSKEEKHLNYAKDYLDSVEKQLGGWVRGQTLLMLLIGTITYIGLTLLGVPYALPLALIAGLLEILPNLGPTIAAIPAIIFAFASGGVFMAGVVTIFYIVIQQLENNIIVPKIMQKSANVNPLISIIVILIGLKVSGVVGALLAVPAYIVIRSIYALWYHKRI